MKIYHRLFRPGMPAVISTLAVSSLICAGLVVGRVIWAGRQGHAFLIWNLFLAWLPLLFAVQFRKHWDGSPAWKAWLWGAAWLLLFPNAPYIFTDLIHLTAKFRVNFWVDLLLILPCALTGLVLGFVSLYLMQSSVAGKLGTLAGWGLVMATAVLSGAGVYLGRFLRLNSWDVLLRPDRLCRHVGNWLADPFGSAAPYVFTVLFAVFLLVAYTLFFALTRLPQSFPPRLNNPNERIR